MADLNETLPRIINLGSRGIICNAEVWNLLADAIEGHNVNSILSGLPVSLQAQLCEIYLDRPWSLNLTAAPIEVRGAMESWCRSKIG